MSGDITTNQGNNPPEGRIMKQNEMTENGDEIRVDV